MVGTCSVMSADWHRVPHPHYKCHRLHLIINIPTRSAQNTLQQLLDTSNSVGRAGAAALHGHDG